MSTITISGPRRDDPYQVVMKVSICFLLLLVAVLSGSRGSSDQSSSHTNNWAVLVCSSRYWFNYRHVANVLSIYRSVKRLGIPDSNIIMMLSDDMACNARNPRPATVFNNANQHINVYGDDIEVDYRGYEVTVENFLRVLTGRLDSSVPRSKRLLSDDRSNILVYMTGHGGDGFLKFQDSEEISNHELGDAFEQMWQKRRYNELLFIIETCQAASMFRTFYSPNIIGVGSSSVDEDALSHHMDSAIGVHIIDRWTYYALEFLERVTPSSKSTLAQFFSSFDPKLVKSTPQVRTDLFRRKLDKVLLTDFFGSVRSIELLNETGSAPVSIAPERGGGEQPTTFLSTPQAYQLSANDTLNVHGEEGDKRNTCSHGDNVYMQTAGIILVTLVTIATSIGVYRLLTLQS